MKAPSPLLGFNNNVKHKGRLFHIQTEDSGIKHPHIITHLFADGGRILKTTKTSYAEHIGAPAMAETVRSLMQEQHKAMFIALRDGQFDHLVDDSGKAAASPSVPKAPPSSGTGVTATSANGADPSLQTAVASTAAKATHDRRPEPAKPIFHAIEDLPPPPVAVIGPRPSSQDALLRASSPLQRAAEQLTPAVGTADPKLGSLGVNRYAPSRPAAIFSTGRPSDGTSIFGEELISEKSLDEVILSYLAEDLDSVPPEK